MVSELGIDGGGKGKEGLEKKKWGKRAVFLVRMEK